MALRKDGDFVTRVTGCGMAWEILSMSIMISMGSAIGLETDAECGAVLPHATCCLPVSTATAA